MFSAQKGFRGNATAFPLDQTKILEVFPPPLDSLADTVLVNFENMNRDSLEHCADMLVRPRKIRAALKFLAQNNPVLN